MMRLMSDLRRSVVLFICPELRDEAAHDAAQQREVSRLWLADDRPAAARARLPLTQVEDDQMAENKGFRFRPHPENGDRTAAPKGKLTAEQKGALESRIFFSGSPWQEVLDWLNEGRRAGFVLPDEGEAYVGQLVLLASDLSGPVGRGRV